MAPKQTAGAAGQAAALPAHLAAQQPREHAR